MNIQHEITTWATDAVWEAAHSSLCAGRWGAARLALEELLARSDNVDELRRVDAYALPDDLMGVLGDRIELVNSRVHDRQYAD